MKLTITLTDREASDMGGWVNYYRAHPEYVGKPPTPGANPPDGQWRIVLDSQTRERFDEIAAQFEAPSTPVDIVWTRPDALGLDKLPWFESASGQVNAVKATASGKISCSDGSGNSPDWISTDPHFPIDESKTAYGSGSSGYLRAVDGQTYYFKQESGSAKQMRASIEP